MQIEVGKEYSYLGRPVKPTRIVGETVYFETRLAELGSCDASELKKWGSAPPPVPAGQAEADDIEMNAADKSYDAGFGVSDWESFLTLGQTKRLIELADQGFGTWAREPERLAQMKSSVAHIASKTD